VALVNNDIVYNVTATTSRQLRPTILLSGFKAAGIFFVPRFYGRMETELNDGEEVIPLVLRKFMYFEIL